MHLVTAQKFAVEFCYKLQPHCHRINIAGSIRRKINQPEDIDLICIPKENRGKDLFGFDTEMARIPEFIETVKSFGPITSGKVATGRLVNIIAGNVKLQIFMPQPEDYFRQYAIRTGSANYAKLIANHWKKKGWCGTKDGLRLIEQSFQTLNTDTLSIWKCLHKNPKLPPVWQSEEEFFNWINLKWIAPALRTI